MEVNLGARLVLLLGQMDRLKSEPVVVQRGFVVIKSLTVLVGTALTFQLF